MNQSISIWRIRKGVPGVGRKLSKHFDCNEITTKNPAAGLADGSYIVNYGRSAYPDWWNKVQAKNLKIINKPDKVAQSVDKRKALALLSEASIPTLESTTDPLMAKAWVQGGFKVVARTLVKSKKGKGIKLITTIDDFVQAPLYTKHYDKTHEFRVHVLGGKVIDYVQKKRMGKAKLESLGLEEADLLIRNHKRGWVFARNDIFKHPAIKQLGIDAARTVGLDLCAVDILAKFSEAGDFIDAVVCETNSAPGMSDINTFKAYTKGLEELMQTGGVTFEAPAPEVVPYIIPEAVIPVGVIKAPKVDTVEYVQQQLGGWNKLTDLLYWNQNDGRLAEVAFGVVDIMKPVPVHLQDAPNHVE